MKIEQRLNEALENRLFLSDQILEVDTGYIFEREDSVVFFVCVVLNSTDDAYVMRLEESQLDVWIHTSTYEEAVNYFEQIEDEFTPEETPDETPEETLEKIKSRLTNQKIIDYANRDAVIFALSSLHNRHFALYKISEDRQELIKRFASQGEGQAFIDALKTKTLSTKKPNLLKFFEKSLTKTFSHGKARKLTLCQKNTESRHFHLTVIDTDEKGVWFESRSSEAPNTRVNRYHGPVYVDLTDITSITQACMVGSELSPDIVHEELYII